MGTFTPVVISSHPATADTPHVRGLISALETLAHEPNGIWLGWSGWDCDLVRPIRLDQVASPRRATIDLPRPLCDAVSSGFCAQVLSPLLAGALPPRNIDEDAWRAYVDANERFAADAMELVTPDGAMWAHDHHLLLFARAVRRHGFIGRIGLFLHALFPEVDQLQSLPWANELVDAMLAFDLIGFSNALAVERFAAAARACTSGVGTDGAIASRHRITEVRTFSTDEPIANRATPDPDTWSRQFLDCLIRRRTTLTEHARRRR